MPLHVSSTMCLSSGGQKLYYTASGIITLCRWPSHARDQPKSGLGDFTFEVSRSHTIKTHLVELLWTSDQPVEEAATYTTHSKHKTRTFMPSAGFELAIPAIKPLQTCALDRTAPAIGARRYNSTNS